MTKFLFALHEQPGIPADVSPEEIQAVVLRYIQWREGLAAKGIILGGEKLTDEGGKHLSRSGSETVVTDGPYSGAKEVMAGFFLIQAADYDEAVAVAETCPHLDYGRIEVRAIEEVG